MDFSLTEITWIACVLFVAGFANGLAGFGFGMTAMAGICLVFEIHIAVPIVAVLGLVVSPTLAFALRKHITLREMAPLLGGALAGLPLGVLFLKQFDPKWVKASLGIFIMLFVLFTVVTRKREFQPAERWWAYPAGFLGGAFGGAFNAAGPPAVVYASTQPWEPDKVRASLQVFLAFAGIFAVIGHTLTGLVTASTLYIDLVTFPAPLIGMWFGVKLGRIINPETFRAILMMVLFLMGVHFIA